MGTILCNIITERQEHISEIVSTTTFKVSMSDISTIPVGSTITNSLQVTTKVRAILEGGVIEVFDSSFALAIGDTILISSIFRYSNLETTIDQNGDTLIYQGRLSVGLINESFGTFIDKKQVISNASVSLLNLDGKLSDIFHSYKLHTGAAVELLYGDTNNYQDFTKYFYGITTSGSNFTYDDSVFSFSIKDFRSTMMDSTIPPTLFDPNLFSKYRAFNVSSTVAYITVFSVPTDWYVGLQVKTLTGSAIISEINGLQLGLTNYSNIISSGQVLDTIFLATATTVVTGSTPLAEGISILGDTGHFIGIEDYTSISTTNITPAAISTTKLVYNHQLSIGNDATLFTAYPLNTNNTMQTSSISGILDAVTMTLPAHGGFKSITATIKVSGVTYSVSIENITNASVNVFDFNFSNLGIKITKGTTVQVTFSIKDGMYITADINSSGYTITPSSVVFGYAQRRSVGGSAITTHTVDLPTEKVATSPTDSGYIFFTRSTSTDLSGSNNCRISAELISTSGASLIFTDIINSGLAIPTQINNSPVATIKFYIKLRPPSNLIDPVELNSLFVSYNTTVISGSISSMGNKPIPLLYGDFTDTAVPAILINTTVDRTFGTNYTFTVNGTSTNSLRYSKIISGSIKVMNVGDSIRYIAGGSTAEEIYAKITQIVPDANTDFGTVYFEDFNIVPDDSSPITVDREINTYKVCDNPLTTIVEYLYLPNKGTILLPLPASVQRSIPLGSGSASGEFVLTGSNLADKIYVKCTGKSDGDGTLIESAEAIIKDLTSLLGLSINTKVMGKTNNVKLRRYINTGVKFSEFLASIEASSNIYTYMSTDNILTINRFATTNEYTKTYREHNIVQDTFQESYDPDNIYADGSILSYNYIPFEDVNSKTDHLGSSATTNLLESSWLWREEDARLVNRQLFSVVNKIPELIQVTIAADDVLSITLGEVIRIIHNNSEHILFVYTYSKDANTNTINIIGWNLAQGYNIDFPVPDFAEFPTNLQTGPYGYRQWLLNDKTITNDVGNYDVNVITSEGFRTATNGSVVPGVAGINKVQASKSVLIIKPSLGAEVTSLYTATYPSGSTTGTLVAATCTEAQITGITGDSIIDNYQLIGNMPLGSGTFTFPEATASDPYLLLYIDEIVLDSLVLFYADDNNIADDRYNYWNPNWGFEQKQYFLNRHNIQGLPPSGLCVSRDSSVVDNITAFKGK